MSQHDYQQLTTSSNNSSTENSSSFVSSMTDSKYSKAIFTEIKDYYSSALIECRFYCDHSLVDSEDHVIVVKVGGVQKLADKKLKDCPEDQDFGERVVTFTKNDLLLPMDQLEDDFFQFQYLKGEEVFGASTPFRITEEEDNEDEDFLVVRSPEALLKERIQRLLAGNGELEEEKRRLLQELEALQNKVVEVETGLKSANEQREADKAVLLSRENELKENFGEKNRLIDEIRVEKREKELLEMRLAEVKMSRDQLGDVWEQRMKEAERRAKEAEQKIKEAEQIYGMERHMTDHKIAEQNTLIEELKGKVGITEGKEELMRTKLAMELSIKRDLEEEIKALKEQVETMTKLNEDMSEKNEMLMKEVLEEDKMRLKTKVMLKTMEEEMEVLRQQKKQFLEKERQWMEKEEERDRVEEEMRQRLEVAAEEYRKVYKQNEKTNEKLIRLKAKVKQYFESKTKKSDERNQIFREIDFNDNDGQEVMTEQPISAQTDSEKNYPQEEAAVRPKELFRAEALEVEERADSESLLVLPCVVCGASIAGRPALVRHLEERHAQRICPICALPFDARVSGHEDYFRMHVENHLDKGYPHK